MKDILNAGDVCNWTSLVLSGIIVPLIPLLTKAWNDKICRRVRVESCIYDPDKALIRVLVRKIQIKAGPPV